MGCIWGLRPSPRTAGPPEGAEIMIIPDQTAAGLPWHCPRPVFLARSSGIAAAFPDLAGTGTGIQGSSRFPIRPGI